MCAVCAVHPAQWELIKAQDCASYRLPAAQLGKNSLGFYLQPAQYSHTVYRQRWQAGLSLIMVARLTLGSSPLQFTGSAGV